MHSDPAAVKKSVRSYMIVFVSLMVFTIITVAVSELHFAVPIAITVALVIAATKGSMVAGVFMHLSHEKQWIYGALLLTFLFFVVLMFVPLFTIMDGIGTAHQAVGTAVMEHR
jgi:caa(3)-type oxidase subunit IV